MKTLALALLVAGSAAGQVSIGINIGAPRPPMYEVEPPPPAPDFFWVQGYWYPVGNHYQWHGGYWTRPPYPGAVWVMPRHDGERFFAGYWNGDRGRWDHDHRWDRDRHRRDFDRSRDRDHDRD